MNKLSIVILNWNGMNYLKDFLPRDDGRRDQRPMQVLIHMGHRNRSENRLSLLAWIKLMKHDAVHRDCE